MRTTRPRAAITAILLLGLGSSIVVGSPAFADTGADGTAPASVAPASVAPTDTSAPVVEVPADPATVTVPAAATVEAPVVVEAPAAEAPATPAEEVPGTPTQTPTARFSIQAEITFPSLAPGHPAPGAPGYTSCWASEVNRIDVNLISPFDMRTWPAYITPSEGQPGYIPHIGAASEGSDVWTQVNIDDPRYVTQTDGTVRLDRIARICSPTGNVMTFTASAEVLDTNDQVISTVSSIGQRGGATDSTQYTPATGRQTNPADINGAVSTRTTFSVQFPVIEPVIDLAGKPTTDYYVGANQFRFSTPTVNESAFGFDRPVGVGLDCDTPTTVFTFGDSANVTCLTQGQMPNITFDEWRTAVLDQFGTGAFIPLTTELSIESRTFSATNPDMTGSWFPGASLQPGFTQFEVKPAVEWLPTAQDKTFRVKAAETLTVTPDGLLAGASWNQGNVGDLETIITNIPTGGILLPDGTLSFTSEQIGDYGFNFVLQDPATGVRSQDATGAIQVYSDSVIVTPPTPPVVIDPIIPVVELMPVAVVQHAKVLGYTGADVGGAGMLAIAFLIAGAAALMFKHRKLRAS